MFPEKNKGIIASLRFYLCSMWPVIKISFNLFLDTGECDPQAAFQFIEISTIARAIEDLSQHSMINNFLEIIRFLLLLRVLITRTHARTHAHTHAQSITTDATCDLWQNLHAHAKEKKTQWQNVFISVVMAAFRFSIMNVFMARLSQQSNKAQKPLTS